MHRTVTLAYPVWAYYVHGQQCRCQEDPVSSPFSRLEKTTRSSLHHVAQHRPTGSETTPYAPRSSRFDSEQPTYPVWAYYVHGRQCRAKRILLVPPSADWRRQPGRPCITWLSTIQKDLKQHHLTLPKAADLTQNRPLWRTMSTYGAAQSWELHARNDDSTCQSCSPKCQALALMPPRDLWPWPQRSMPWP